MRKPTWILIALAILVVGLFVLALWHPWTRSGEQARRSCGADHLKEQKGQKCHAPDLYAMRERDREEEEGGGEKRPYDWFYMQRAYPNWVVNDEARMEMYRQAEALSARYAFLNLAPWTQKGPTNIGGRITGLALHPTNASIIYAGAADGGMLKSTDGGVTWAMLTDNLPSLSVGDVAIDPNNPNTVYAGMGEANLAGDNYDGDGVYRTTDAGATWTNLGLTRVKRIGRVAVHPTNSNVLFVAGAGAQFSADSARGVYRSTNGGTTWSKVLYVSDSTSAIDLRIDPTRPDTVYAAMWERLRSPTRRKAGGATSGIWRSTDMGTTWARLTSGLPSGVTVGRIGLAIAKSSPDILYAIYADSVGYFTSVYKTTNAGNTWAVTAGQPSGLFSSYGWYFGQIRVSPANPDIVFGLGVPLYRSTNGGTSWSNASGSQHVDHHAMEFDLSNPNRIVDGNDGGVFYSTNGGTAWTKSYNLPITQFYAATIDDLLPQRTYGGTQDNGTVRTQTGNLNDWADIYGGDGMYCLVDYTNSQIIYAESQNGNFGKSTNGGSSFFSAMNGINLSDRMNWSTPVVMDPNNHLVLYFGTHRLYKTTDGAANWTAISGDLTNGPGPGNLVYGTITTEAVAKTNGNVVYVGTDDANVWVTTNGGTNWTRINTGLPNRWVTRVAVDPSNAAIAYVTFSGYRIDSPLPHVYRTTNYGASWASISSNLPEGPVNVIVINPITPTTLFVGTDYGVYFSLNSGGTWYPVGTGLPRSAVDDLMLHNATRKLRAATHGRSILEFDLTQLSGVDYGKPVLKPIEGLKLVVTSPTQGEIRLSYSLPKAGTVRIALYDATGRRVQSLSEGVVSPGAHELRQPLGLASGTYFVKVEALGQILTRKVVVVK